MAKDTNLSHQVLSGSPQALSMSGASERHGPRVTFAILPLYYCRASERLRAHIVIPSKCCFSEQKGRMHMKPLRIAALVKQIPRFEEMQLGPDGRLKRDGVELAMNPYCLQIGR